MAMDFEDLKIGFSQAVPMVATLGMEFVDLDQSRAAMRLPDQEDFHNHVGGPHAGAIFSLAESASGALIMANFGDRLDQATPLAVESTIRYRALAKGDITATAVMSRTRGQILSELDSGQRPEFAVDVEVVDANGKVTSEMTIIWTLKPNRRG